MIDAYCSTGTSPTPAPHSSRRGEISLRGHPTLDPGLTRSPSGVPYELYGNSSAGLPVAVLGGISAGRHLASSTTDPRRGWWDAVIGPGYGLDPSRNPLLGIDYLRPGIRPARPTAGDQADALLAVMDGLEIERLGAIVGASFGGLVALHFAAAHPDRVDRVVVAVAAHRSSAWASGCRHVQSKIVELGRETGRPGDGVALARSLASLTYVTADGLDGRFPDGHSGLASPALAAFLEEAGDRFSRSFDPDTFSSLITALEADAVEPERIRVPLVALSVEGDLLVPPTLVEELVRRAAGPARHVRLRSSAGHDAFLEDVGLFGPALRSALGSGEGCRSCAAATAAARAGVGADGSFGAVMPPVYLSTNYLFDDIGRPGPYDYTRSGNPTRAGLAHAIADLEGGEGAVVTSSGMAAITTVLHTFAAGSRLLVAHDCYGGLDRLLRALAARGALDVRFADLSDTENAIRSIESFEPDAVWIETPSNPLLRITDVSRISDAASRVGAVTVVDNTFLSPALQRPLERGADIVVHSTTKFLNGHSDVVGGAAVASSPERLDDLSWWANCLGVTGAPFDSYLTLRGLRTLWARVERHGRGTEAVVAVLSAHPAVARVYYPGLPDHPGHEVAAAQQSGFGSMVSFELRGGLAAARRFVGGLRHISLAESLGGVESLVCHPATMTHAAMDPDARIEAGINDSLLRISVGIEDAGDLAEDVLAALDRSEAPCPAR